MESSRAAFEAYGAYDNGRQVNDGVQPNPKGHDRYLAAAASLRLPWRLPSMEPFLGCGWRWNQLSTTRYTKGADRPQIGGGLDYWQRACPTCHPNFSMRLGMNWVLAGSDWQNGVHGAEISISIPSLREARHCFFVATIGIYGFHQTVTDRTKIQLMRSQRADRAVFPVLSLGLLYRF
jgi:hypothetical protein